MRIGFVGVGSLAAAMVAGLRRDAAAPESILLSPRNAATATDLAARFADVAVAADNQSVLDGADLVVVCLRPAQAEVLAALAFRAEHVVVSVMAGVPLVALARLVAPATAIAQAIPLPTVALGQGLTPVHPPLAPAVALLDRLGRALPVDGEEAFEALSAASGTVAAHCDYMAAIARWLAAHGLAEEAAAAFVASIFAGLAPELAEGGDLARIARAHATPGGINELFASHLSDAGLPRMVESGLDAVLARLKGVGR